MHAVRTHRHSAPLRSESYRRAQSLRSKNGTDAYAFTPGYVATGFGADSAIIRLSQFVSHGSFGISPEQGAAPLIHLASTPDVGPSVGEECGARRTVTPSRLCVTRPALPWRAGETESESDDAGE